MAQAGITGTEFNGGESCENITAEESRKPEELYPISKSIAKSIVVIQLQQRNWQ